MARCVSVTHSLESAYKEPSSQGAGPGCTKTILKPTEPLQNITVNFKVVANHPDKTSRHEVAYDTTGSSSNLYAEETELARTTDLYLCRAKKFLARAQTL